MDRKAGSLAEWPGKQEQARKGRGGQDQPEGAPGAKHHGQRAAKSVNSLRTLPLDNAVTDALTALRKQQMAEAAAAAPAYQPSGYVVTDELGAPVHPEWFSDEWGRLIRKAGLRKIRLHDSRHTALSLMEKAGVPVSVISAWAGHYSPSFTMSTYLHAEAEDLAVGRDALGRIYGSGETS